MAECRISNALAQFLIELAIDTDLYREFQDQQQKEAVMAREKFALTEDDKQALRSGNSAAIRYRLDNIQIHP